MSDPEELTEQVLKKGSPNRSLGNHDAIMLYHAIMLSSYCIIQYHAAMLPCYHAISYYIVLYRTISCYHAIMLSCYQAIMLSCYLAIMLSCNHAVMLSCCHAFMLSCYHAVILSYPLTPPKTKKKHPSSGFSSASESN